MSEFIEDGTGKGYLAKVTNANKLRTYSTSESEASFESETNERCYFWAHAYDYDANDTILFLRNDSSTLNLLIEKVHMWSDVTTQFIIFSPANPTTPTGTTVTGVNGNRRSSLIADVTAIGDETTNTRANILTQGIALANTTTQYPIDGKVVLGYNNCIAVDFVTAGTLGSVTIVGYYHEVL